MTKPKTKSQPLSSKAKGRKLPNPFIGTVVCVKKAGQNLWWPAVATKQNGAPFSWRRKRSVWKPDERNNDNAELVVTARYFHPWSTNGSSVGVVRPEDHVKPFAQRFVDAPGVAMPKHLLHACFEALSHIQEHGTEMEKTLVREKWIADILPQRNSFPTREEINSEAQRWKKMQPNLCDVPPKSVVWACVRDSLWWPASVVSKRSDESDTFCVVRFLNPVSIPGESWPTQVNINRVLVFFAGMTFFQSCSRSHHPQIMKACREARKHISVHGTKEEKEYLKGAFFAKLFKALKKKMDHREQFSQPVRSLQRDGKLPQKESLIDTERSADIDGRREGGVSGSTEAGDDLSSKSSPANSSTSEANEEKIGSSGEARDEKSAESTPSKAPPSCSYTGHDQTNLPSVPMQNLKRKLSDTCVKLDDTAHKNERSHFFAAPVQSAAQADLMLHLSRCTNAVNILFTSHSDLVADVNALASWKLHLQNVKRDKKENDAMLEQQTEELAKQHDLGQVEDGKRATESIARRKQSTEVKRSLAGMVIKLEKLHAKAAATEQNISASRSELMRLRKLLKTLSD